MLLLGHIDYLQDNVPDVLGTFSSIMGAARLYMNMFNFACIGTWKLLKIVALIIYLSSHLLSKLSGFVRWCLETQERAGGGQGIQLTCWVKVAENTLCWILALGESTSQLIPSSCITEYWCDFTKTKCDLLKFFFIFWIFTILNSINCLGRILCNSEPGLQ